ncbi:MAG: hypothetical protein NC402_07850 [Prevotella sp.]|nr:hypothetical protein [Prevotella sp.]MCM1075708.1 hypothetical protein [Ruminococcus sp.]
MKRENKIRPAATDPKLIQRRKWAESAASVGMILIIVAMFLPLLNMLSTEHLPIFKWIFASGTVLYWGARCVDISSEGESLRIRRLRRIEFWAGACFGVAAFFWFFNEHKYGEDSLAGPLTILKDTILFALAGAVLQIVAAWMIYFRQKKETEGSNT